jgi:hypothetical protein
VESFYEGVCRMKSIGTRWAGNLGVSSLLASVLGLAGCSGPDDGMANEENLGESAQAFGSASCAAATANQVFSGFIPLAGATSPTTYNTCLKGYVVDVLSLSPEYSGSGTLEDANLNAYWTGLEPQTQAACEASWGRAIFYQKVDDSWVAVTGDVDSYGVWEPGLGYCRAPYLTSAGHIGLHANISYRMAATMRTAYAGSTTHSMTFQTSKSEDNP